MKHLALLLGLCVLLVATTYAAKVDITAIERKAQAALRAGKVEAAIQAYQEGLHAAPDDLFLLSDLATIYGKQERFQDALGLLHHALDVAGKSHKAIVCYNLGHTYMMAGDISSARHYWIMAIERDPTFRPAYVKAAWASQQIGDVDATVGYLQTALKLDPKDPSTLLLLGDAFNNRKRWDDAIQAYTRAMQLDTRNPEIRLHLGDTLANLRRHDEAHHQYARGLKFSPDHPGLLAAMWQSSLDLAHWKAYHKLHSKLLSSVSNTRLMGVASPLSPYRAMATPMPASWRTNISRSWMLALAAEERLVPASAAGNTHTPTPSPYSFRLGYISRRFQRYPGTQLMLRLFRAHSRPTFRVICFASGPDDGSWERQVVADTCDDFVDVSLLSPVDTASVIAKYNVSTLIDYDGLHDFNNLRTLFHMPAPVQLSWLGFASTIAAPEIVSHIISDAIITPADHPVAQFGEPHVLLPSTYQPQDPLHPIEGWDWNAPDLQAQLRAAHLEIRQQYGLPHDGLVIACFNRIGKVDPTVFDAWTATLRRNRRITLWLLESDTSIRARIVSEAVARGVLASQIVFANSTDKAHHYRRHFGADLFVDTLTYGAHTTASDALLTGLPVLTLPGDALASRVAASLLAASDSTLASKFITTSLKDYEAVLQWLLANPAVLTTARTQLLTAAQAAVKQAHSKLEATRACDPQTSKLFQVNRFTASLQSAVLATWETRHASDSLMHIVADRGCAATE